MVAAHPVGRLGPLAAALGIGAAMALAGAAVADADAGDPAAPANSTSVRTEPRSDAPRSDARPSPGPETGQRHRADRAPSRGTAPRARQRSAAAATGGGLGALLNNRTPTVSAGRAAQSPGGVVRGQLDAADEDSSPLGYTVTRQPEHGSVAVEPDGSYTYTADPALAATGTSDTFTVSVSDAGSGFHIHGLLGLLNLLTFGLIGSSGHVATVTVGVTVAPFSGANRPPSGTVSAGSPDPVSGVITGAVIGSDPDGDPLTYSGSATTGKGTVSVSTTGTFVYTPTAAARQNAAASGAAPADLQDGFTVTISDGHGGSAPVAVTVAVLPAGSPAGALAAFPGAEGFGANATGGRDGSVIYVTTLAADGPGSLQWAIDQPGARYILFTVSGLIDTQIHLTNGDVTIAGQTSPGGITVRGFVTDETPYQDQAVQAPGDFAENWILQHIRIRPVSETLSDDGLRLRYTRNAIVDHVSIGNAIDEAIEISYSNNITVQNTVIAETIGGHSFYGGVLMNYSNPANGFGLDNISLHHNIFNRIEGRLPEGSRESAAAANSFMSLELSNNLYWDPRFFIALGVDTAVAGGQPIYWKLNAVNNFFRTAPGFQFGMFDDQILNIGRNELFISGNTMSLYPSRSDYQLFYCCNDYPSESSPDATSRSAQGRTSRHPFPAITYTPTDRLIDVLLNTAGAWPRDPMDTRLMQSVATNTISAAPPNTNPANDALRPAFSGSAPSAPVDTDTDGMPDVWEITKGLNPNIGNTNARTLSPVGYTDLEVYLQELSANRITGWV